MQWTHSDITEDFVKVYYFVFMVQVLSREIIIVDIISMSCIVVADEKPELS